MKYEIELYLTVPEITKWMRRLDLCHPDKYFVAPYAVTIDTKSDVNEEYFKNMVKTLGTIDTEKQFVAAVSCLDEFYFAPGVKIISDGKFELWNHDEWINDE